MLKKITNKKKLLIISSLIFIVMFILNCYTPLIADDFGYSLNLSKEHLTGIKDIINFQILHYRFWGGRIVAHTLAQIFLLFPKMIFNTLNSLCFCFLIYLIYRISEKKEKPYLLLVIFFLIYFFTPRLGQTTIWLVGSCNYLWTTTIMLFLIYEENKKKNDTIKNQIFLLLLGIIAGWTNENTALGLIIYQITTILYLKKDKKNIEKYKVWGLIGTIIGYLILMIAPGNYVRNNTYEKKGLLIITLITRIQNITIGMISNLFPLIIGIIILISIYKYQKKKINKKSICIICAALVSIYSMIISPTFPERAWFGGFIFLLIAVINMLAELNIEKEKVVYYIIIDSLLITSLIFYVDYSNLLNDINELNNTWIYREKVIQKNKNQQVFEFNEYRSNNRKNPNYELGDLATTKDDWPSNEIEKYYKKESITIK